MRIGDVFSLSPYQTQWADIYEAEKAVLQKIFGDAILEIEHIGSTAVEGLLSRPIIDMAVMIDQYEQADQFVEPLSETGYIYEPPRQEGRPERHFFTKGNPIVYHLSIAYTDCGGFWPRQIYFRDYLRTHPEARDEYARLKRDLEQKDLSGKTYVAGKTDFVYRILKLAGWKAFEAYQKPDTKSPAIVDVQTQNNYTISLTFDTGENGTWDLKPHLAREGFRNIATYDTFDTVHISNNTIVWENGLPIDPNYLYNRCITQAT